MRGIMWVIWNALALLGIYVLGLYVWALFNYHFIWR